MTYGSEIVCRELSSVQNRCHFVTCFLLDVLVEAQMVHQDAERRRGSVEASNEQNIRVSHDLQWIRFAIIIIIMPMLTYFVSTQVCITLQHNIDDALLCVWLCFFQLLSSFFDQVAEQGTQLVGICFRFS